MTQDEALHRAAIDARCRETLRRSGETLERVAQARAERGPVEMWTLAEPEPVQAQPQPQPSARRTEPERRYASEEALLALAREAGDTVWQMGQRIDTLERRLADNEQATVDLIRDLENEIKELKSKAVLKPAELRLINSGGSDAA